MSGFRVDTGQVAGIWVAIGVAIFDIKEKDKIITVLKGCGHC
jgi:Zn-dependent alcohol dehydrogenase